MGPGGYVAVGSTSTGPVGRIWHSADGSDWRLVDSALLEGLDLESVAATAGAFVAVGTRTGDEGRFGAALLRSTDGLGWTEVSDVADAPAGRIAAGPAGFAAIVQPGDTTDLLLSSDGISWSRIPGAGIAPGGWLSDIAWDGSGWIAAGSVGDRALVVRSTDGRAWTEELTPASEPAGKIAVVTAYRVIPGRWATLVLGLDEEASCKEDDDFCPKYQAAWSRTDQAGWQRLASSTWILGRGHGVDVYPARDAGFLYLLGDDARVSADGWDWKPVTWTGGASAFVRSAVVVGDDLVAVGSTLNDDPPAPWFGHAAISR